MKELPVIGFDAKRAAQNRTGLGNYSRFVIRGLAKWVPNLRLYLFTPCAEKTNAIAGIDKLAAVTLHHPEGFFWRHFRALWRQWGVSADAANKKVKLFHGLTGELPWGLHRKGIMSVVTIHDLIFLRYPRYYHLIDRWIYHWKFRSACCRADRIIAVSECTKRDIMHFFGTPEEKISVVYQGCDERFRQPVSDTIKKEVRARYQLPEHYILYVGSIEERKNLMLLAEALPLLKDKNLQVVAVGRRTSYANRIDAFIRSHDLTNRFRMVSGVPSVDLPVFYQLADVFVYPSRFEGFGIPLLEALCSGTPAIGCTGSCLEEAGGPTSLYVNPDNAQVLATAIDRVQNDKELKEKMIEDGLRWAGRFQVELLTQNILKVYCEVLHSTKPSRKDGA